MAEVEQNIKLRAGNSRTMEFTVSGVTSLTNTTLKWGLSKAPHTAKLVEKTNATSAITYSGLVVTVNLAPADTKDLDPARYYHELWAEDVVGYRDTLAVGQVRIYASLFST